MRMTKGQPFMDVPAEFSPEPDALEELGGDVPVFSEMALYAALGKGDARFVLGVADEYDHLIKALGPEAVRMILSLRPQLVQQLRVPEIIKETLANAQDENKLPAEAILPIEQARAVADLLGYILKKRGPERMEEELLAATAPLPTI